MKNKFSWLDIILAFIVIFSLVLVSGIIKSAQDARLIEAENIATSLAAELQLSIDDQFTIMDSVESFTRIEFDKVEFQKEFDAFVAPLYAKNKAIKNISIAPDGVQAYVYPLKGNEMVIGHDLVNDERDNVRRDVARTIQTRQTAVSGPYELRQGGFGLISRKAIYTDDAFWGLVAMVTDFDAILNRLSINNLNTSLAIQLYGPTDELIRENKTLTGQILSTKLIVLPEGEIQLVIGESDQSASELYRVYLIWGLFVLILLTLSVTIYLQNRKYLKSLQKDLNDRIIQVNILSNELEKGKMMAIGSLVRGLCHEVNTPLGSSLTLATFVERELENGQKPSDEMKESVGAAVSNIKKSIGIIEKLRDITEIQSAHKIIPFNIKEYLEFAVLNSKLSTSEKAIQVKIDCPDEYRIVNNPSAFYQVINLLIENAIVHGFKNVNSGLISISILRIDKSYQIIFEDNGVGVSQDKLHNIFEPYYTSDMSQFQGLGLYTVFTLINNHIKGEIHVESEGGQFTRFIITIDNLEQS